MRTSGGGASAGCAGRSSEFISSVRVSSVTGASSAARGDWRARDSSHPHLLARMGAASPGFLLRGELSTGVASHRLGPRFGEQLLPVPCKEARRALVELRFAPLALVLRPPKQHPRGEVKQCAASC